VRGLLRLRVYGVKLPIVGPTLSYRPKAERLKFHHDVPKQREIELEWNLFSTLWRQNLEGKATPARTKSWKKASGSCEERNENNFNLSAS
jgi:hypothetical protein